MPGAARPSNVRRDRGRGASSGTDSGGKGSASETGGKGTVRRLGRNQSPHSESSTPSLMPPVPPAAQMWSTDESSFDEAGEDRYLFGESRVSGYMKRRRASRAEGPREAPAAPSPSACASLPATSSSAGAESPGRHAPKSPSATRGSLLESLSEGVASIWPRGERSSPRSPSRDSFQSTVLVTKDGEPPPQEGLKDLIEETAEDREAAGSPQAQAKRSSFLQAAELAQSLKRLSSDLSAGVVSMADALRAAPAPEASWTGARDHDTEASASSSADRSLNLDALMNEAHLPFRQLLQEVPDPENTPGGILASFPRLRNLQTQESRDDAEHSLPGDDASASASSLHFGAQSPLFSAVVRARLAAHLIGCYESVTGELSGEEIQLWER
ncbi:unnamed protein product [Effrenium voratum]|uniref:Uncharacterized protein n=1 Tax=Effrenium voratum TaxID=2562239 RepID=A0AA36J1T2_9DINO|nr:unnamed protein product [Effrenium voratum]